MSIYFLFITFNVVYYRKLGISFWGLWDDEKNIISIRHKYRLICFVKLTSIWSLNEFNFSCEGKGVKNRMSLRFFPCLKRQVGWIFFYCKPSFSQRWRKNCGEMQREKKQRGSFLTWLEEKTKMWIVFHENDVRGWDGKGKENLHSTLGKVFEDFEHNFQVKLVFLEVFFFNFLLLVVLY